MIKKDESNAAEAAELRHRAEERLRPRETDTLSRTDVEAKSLLHELQVHRIELEMQNEELRQRRDEVETALEKYTDLYDFAPVGYFTLDHDGIIREVNLTGALLMEIERSRLIGRRFESFVSGEARPAFTAFLRKLSESQGKERLEVALQQKGTRPLQIQIEASSYDHRKECRFAVLDITERRQLEKKLEVLSAKLAARNAELETANIELEAFNSSVSHDLRQPLGNINGYCQMIEHFCADQLDKQCSGYVRNIFEATLTMSGLIDTLLNFSRVLRVEIHNDTVDLSELSKAVAASLANAEPERRVTFLIAEQVHTLGDPGLLEIVLNNLIGNAWKYSGKQDETVIEFGVTEKEGEPAYFVRDNGPGFDMADAGQLFAPFQRLSGTDVKGHGIGLAMVDRIIRRHGGRVWAESEPGKGAAFYFTLQMEGIAAQSAGCKTELAAR